MQFDELISQSRAPEKLALFTSAYRAAQSDARGIPMKSALSMRDLAPCLANTTLMEILDDQRALYRVAGENVVARLGFNPTGRDFLTLLAPEDRGPSALSHKTCLERPCGTYLVYENSYENGRRMISESLMVPLFQTGETQPNLIMGYHIHHEASGFSTSEGQTRLISDLIMMTFVDIGNGMPALAPRKAKEAMR